MPPVCTFRPTSDSRNFSLVQPAPHFFKAASNTMPLAQPSVSLSTGRLTSYFFAAAPISSKIGSFSTRTHHEFRVLELPQCVLGVRTAVVNVPAIPALTPQSAQHLYRRRYRRIARRVVRIPRDDAGRRAADVRGRGRDRLLVGDLQTDRSGDLLHGVDALAADRNIHRYQRELHLVLVLFGECFDQRNLPRRRCSRVGRAATAEYQWVHLGPGRS